MVSPGLKLPKALPACITQRIYPPRADSLGITLVASGDSVKLKSLDTWDMSLVDYR